MKFYADKRVVFGLLTTLLVLLLLGYYSFKNNQRLSETNGWVVHTTEVLYYIEQVQSNAFRLEQVVAKFIITGDTSYMRRFNEELRRASINYNKVRELTADNPKQHDRIDSLRSMGRAKIGLLQMMIDLRKKSKNEAELVIGSQENSLLNTRMYATIEAMRASENQLLELRLSESRLDLKRFQITFLTLMIAVIVVLAGVYLLIDGSFKARLKAEQKTKLINQELEAFTYSVSHDLRAPLRSIRGFTGVLKEEYGDKIDEEGNRLLGIVMRNASQMGQLIDDLLDFSRIGRKELSFSMINTNQLVQEVVEELRTHEPERRINFTTNPLPSMEGDLSLIKQVWVNLISNAIKYTRQAATPHIEIGSMSNEEGLFFFVRDNGVGFDMKYQDKLFKVFQRLHHKSVFEGTGVGLALVHRIVTRHGGKIWADAEVNKGATFYFTIQNK